MVERIRAALPLRAFTTKGLRKTLQQGSKQRFPPECSVAEVHYLGDEGGIACALDFGFDDTKEVHIVSLTHLTVDRRDPLAREIEAYCKHRIKRIKKTHGGAGFT